jgi:hypothetical protein
MASKVFAEANLLLDFILHRTGYPAALQVMQHAINGTIKLCTNPAVLHITSYIPAGHLQQRKPNKLYLHC